MSHIKAAISNLAWAPDNREEAYALMADKGVRGLEIAPGLLFPTSADAFCPAREEVATVKKELRQYGLEIVSMQSLLFSTPSAQLFGTPEAQILFTEQMTRAIELAHQFHIPNLVLGSPKQRIVPVDMTPTQVENVCVKILLPLADLAQTCGTRIALEPNPAAYGTNFMTTLEDTVAVAQFLNHPAITVNFDTGSMLLNNQIDVAAWQALYTQYKKFISHVHMSNPQLAPLPENKLQAKMFRTFLCHIAEHNCASIEMLHVPGKGLENVAQALTIFAAGE